MMDKNALTLASMARSSVPHEAAIGMAAINSLIEVDEQRCVELNAGDLLALEGQGKRVAIAGHYYERGKRCSPLTAINVRDVAPVLVFAHRELSASRTT